MDILCDRQILSIEKYTGDVLLQKTFRRDIFSGKQIRNHGEHAQYLYENNHGGIITHEMFERVQMEKQRRSNRCCSDNGGMRRKNTRFSQGNTLSGKIQCEECGRNFGRIKTRKGNLLAVRRSRLSILRIIMRCKEGNSIKRK